MNTVYCSDITEACKLAREIFADLEDAQFEMPPQGQQNFVLIHNDTVIRMARHEWAAQTMEREITLLQLLAPHTPVAMPAFHQIIPEHHVMRTSHVPGQPLSSPIIERFSEAQTHAAAEQLAAFMAYMHEGVTLTDAQKLYFKGDHSYFHDRVRPLIEARRTHNTPASVRKKWEDAKNYMDHYQDLPDDIVLIHGDLMSGNILYDDKTQKIGIVDFTGSSRQYRHLEFKKLLSYPPHFFNAVITAYEAKTGTIVDIDLVKTAYSLNEAFNKRNEPQPPYQLPSSAKPL